MTEPRPLLLCLLVEEVPEDVRAAFPERVEEACARCGRRVVHMPHPDPEALAVCNACGKADPSFAEALRVMVVRPEWQERMVGAGWKGPKRRTH